MYWCKRLKDLREDADLTISQLAKVLDVSERTISRYEDGTSQPNISILIKLSLLYNVSIDYICGVKDTPDIVEKDLKEKLEDLSKILDKIIKDM